jgi:hypothetical protein
MASSLAYFNNSGAIQRRQLDMTILLQGHGPIEKENPS